MDPVEGEDFIAMVLEVDFDTPEMAELFGHLLTGEDQ